VVERKWRDVSAESEPVVHDKIPESDHADGEEFGDVEVDFESVVGDVNKQVGNAEAGHGDKEEGEVFGGDLLVVAVEGPEAVEEIVGGGCNDKSAGVGEVLVGEELLFE